jgi:hypothetical protein
VSVGVKVEVGTKVSVGAETVSVVSSPTGDETLTGKAQLFMISMVKMTGRKDFVLIFIARFSSSF